MPALWGVHLLVKCIYQNVNNNRTGRRFVKTEEGPSLDRENEILNAVKLEWRVSFREL
jgi:hypothetical protein